MGKTTLGTGASASRPEPEPPRASAAATPPSAGFSGGEPTGLTPDGEVTETVTLPSPWEIARLTERQWNDLEIPAFLRRTDTTPSEPRPATTKNAPIPPAVGSAGGPSGGSSKSAPPSGITGGMFDHFRVDPEEIESKIRHEADRRWRAWVPTKEHLSRPRKSYYEKQVRKEFYP